ncbi:MAG: hypothetical protein ABW022_14915 [Actinoplanes sp.]
MKHQPCPDGTAHGPHEWYWKNILRRSCPGLVVAFCGRDECSEAHWCGEFFDEWCPGREEPACEHGRPLLDECLRCAVWLPR